MFVNIKLVVGYRFLVISLFNYSLQQQNLNFTSCTLLPIAYCLLPIAYCLLIPHLRMNKQAGNTLIFVSIFYRHSKQF